MKKFSVILLLNLFLFSNTASGSWLKPKLFNPNTTSFKSGEVYEGEVSSLTVSNGNE